MPRNNWQTGNDYERIMGAAHDLAYKRSSVLAVCTTLEKMGRKTRKAGEKKSGKEVQKEKRQCVDTS